jgi:hypothetical protein
LLPTCRFIGRTSEGATSGSAVDDHPDRGVCAPLHPVPAGTPGPSAAQDGSGRQPLDHDDHPEADHHDHHPPVYDHDRRHHDNRDGPRCWEHDNHDDGHHLNRSGQLNVDHPSGAVGRRLDHIDYRTHHLVQPLAIDLSCEEAAAPARRRYRPGVGVCAG